VLGATGGPDITLFGIHPATVLLVGVYLYGLRIAFRDGSIYHATDSQSIFLMSSPSC